MQNAALMVVRAATQIPELECRQFSVSEHSVQCRSPKASSWAPVERIIYGEKSLSHSATLQSHYNNNEYISS